MFVYGKLDPHPEDTHPRVYLSDHLQTLTPVPEVVDWASRIGMWPMYMNDRLGDCTCAALGHALESWTTYSQGKTLLLPDSAILSLYEAVSGYDPQTGANDHGAVEQDVLAHVQKQGFGGHKILAFAQVDHKNLDEMKRALDFFGTVYLGFQVPKSAEDQFARELPWTPVLGSPNVGGHAIDLQKWDGEYMYAVTWGRLQPMTAEFWLEYGDEAWVIVTEDWLDSKGQSPLGLDIQGLVAEFRGLTGQVIQPKKCGFFSAIKRVFSR